MKLLVCNGLILTVYPIGEPIYRVSQDDGGPPIKHNGYRIVEDDEARAILEELRASGAYRTERLA